MYTILQIRLIRFNRAMPINILKIKLHFLIKCATIQLEILTNIILTNHLNMTLTILQQRRNCLLEYYKFINNLFLY